MGRRKRRRPGPGKKEVVEVIEGTPKRKRRYYLEEPEASRTKGSAWRAWLEREGEAEAANEIDDANAGSSWCASNLGTIRPLAS